MCERRRVSIHDELFIVESMVNFLPIHFESGMIHWKLVHKEDTYKY